MSTYDTDWRAVIEAELAALRQGEAERARAAGTVSLDQQKVGRLSRMDALQMQAMARAETSRARQRQQQLLAALRRLECDEFGWCEVCGEAIPEARLRANPVARACMECAR